MSRINFTLASIAVMLSTSAVIAADIVVYSTGADGRGRSRVFGEIVDYTGKELRIRQASGRESAVPSDRVVEIQSEWIPQQKKGDEFFKAGKFTEALDQYREAGKTEHRKWAQRGILAQQVWCLRATGKVEQACVAFLGIYVNDSTTQYFDAIPLAWKTQQPSVSLERRAKSWIDDKKASVTTLIGASWLLSSRDRSAAIAALRQLATDSDPRIAHLAEAQMWRTQIVTAKPPDITRWQKQIENMPKPLRAGPYYLVGQAMSRFERREEAALTFMRVPILYPRDHDLVANALHAAGRELEQIGRADEAVGLYREIVSDYADVPVAAEATGRLEALTRGATKQ